MRMQYERTRRIAIVGGGPSGLFLFKTLIENALPGWSIDIFESKDQLGAGMPYSIEGATREHVTNVSGNEIPKLVTSLKEWITNLSVEMTEQFQMQPYEFSDYHVLPRLLFGKYLADQFNLLLQKAGSSGVTTAVHLNTTVIDIRDMPEMNAVKIETGTNELFEFDKVILCTGHSWPPAYEGLVAGYFDSPYPPSKLKLHFDHPVAIRGSSLTAIDAVRTLARNHGEFKEEGPHQLSFIANDSAGDFRIVMHSRQGLLPAIRFHLDDPHLSKYRLLTKEDIEAHMSTNNGFLSLDFIFEKDFKEGIRDKDPGFYDRIKDMNMESFVDSMMSLREKVDPFVFLKREYEEAKQSIRNQESVYWKEMLAVLSFAMNYPAKHFAAEDMLRLQKVLMPLISIVIAFVPQRSCEEIIALHHSGRLELVPVGDDSHVEIIPEGGIAYHYTNEAGILQTTTYQTYVDCAGQPHLPAKDFPFKSLLRDGTVSEARLKFLSAQTGKSLMNENKETIIADTDSDIYLKVPGIAITDSFRAVDKNGKSNPRLFIMAVPYIGGYNPDYSGLDFCEEASRLIVRDITGQWADGS